MPKVNLTLAQKKITIIALILLLVFVAVWLFLYLPSRNTLRRLKAELVFTENQIQAIQAILGRGVSLAQGMASLKARDKELSAGFPSKEEESIKFFSEFAKGLGIELESIKSEPMRPLLIDKERVLIENRACYYVPVSIQMNCSFADFVKYAEGLEKSLPALVTLENLKVARDKSDIKKLDIALELNLYLLP
ncbi:MAG: hypothetical protein H8D90_02150 [Candidatus Omnitrophica bacterium]|nr:hypothetical protein [Candidatus Omnitrophota bacterium]MBL7151293.1 hypothetical protein [Candidatus Omnitrophota bacterium]